MQQSVLISNDILELFCNVLKKLFFNYVCAFMDPWNNTNHLADLLRDWQNEHSNQLLLVEHWGHHFREPADKKQIYW